MHGNTSYIHHYDELTGLPSNGYLKQRLRQKLKSFRDSESGFALLILDIDEFKYINDALGYEVADKLIVQISERIKILDEKYELLSRHFGVQFSILIGHKDSFEEYRKVVEAIFNLFLERFLVEKYELDINVTIGASIYRAGAQSAEELVREAQSALSWAKLAGKNRFQFYSSSIANQDFKQFELKNDLRKAIEQRQFEVYYQPLVDLKTGKISSAEALIRWNHPRFGLVSPFEFISIAEESGLIIDLGDWILKDVCKTYLNWTEKGFPDIKISVNFSSVQFLEEDFVDKVIRTVRKHGLSPSFIVAEITESIFIKNPLKVTEDIKKLQSFGVQIALDDFGSGFSSLMYLSKFNIDILKTDKFFMEDISKKNANTIIFESIVKLVSDLDISLVVEGIETAVQQNYVKSLGCPIGQGYLFSRPIEASRFESFLMQGKL